MNEAYNNKKSHQADPPLIALTLPIHDKRLGPQLFSYGFDHIIFVSVGTPCSASPSIHFGGQPSRFVTAFLNVLHLKYNILRHIVKIRNLTFLCFNQYLTFCFSMCYDFLFYLLFWRNLMREKDCFTPLRGVRNDGRCFSWLSCYNFVAGFV